MNILFELIAAFGILYFIGSQIFIEWVNRDTMHWLKDTISSYIAGVKAETESQLGFAMLAIGLASISMLQHGWLVYPLRIAALAIVPLVWSYIRYIGSGKRHVWMTIHGISTFFLIAPVLVFEFAKLNGSIEILVPVLGVLYAIAALSRLAVAEKVLVACIIASFAFVIAS